MNERKERKKSYSQIMSRDNIKNMSEEDFRFVISSLWASGLWTNKDWKIDRLLEDNGNIQRINEALYDVLYGEDPLYKRYNTFRGKITGIGSAMLSEMMTFLEPNKYGIWNNKPITVIPFLEVKHSLPDRVFKYQITGEDYEKCISILSIFKEELKTICDDPDFIDVDFFLAFIFYEIMPNEPIPEPPVIGKGEGKGKEPPIRPKVIVNSHTTAQKALIELGNLLGYDTYIPPEDRGKIVDNVKLEEFATLLDLPQFTFQDILDTVKHIDVIWFKEEFPIFGFEIEESTDVTKGLLRLYQIRKLHIKPVIVGPESKKTKFFIEMKKDPFNKIKDTYRFVSYTDLSKFIEVAETFTDLKKVILGI